MSNVIPRIVFFSSRSENTLRALNKVNLPSVRLPTRRDGEYPKLTHDYVLVVPTFGAGKTLGAIPMPVRDFLNKDEESRNHCVGVIGGGNTTFSSFATSSDLIAKKLQVPALYKFEVLGMPHEIIAIREIMFELFPDLEQYRDAEPGTFAHPSAFR